MFADFISKSMEVYTDDMLVKSLRVADHIEHLKAAFNILRKYRMRLNPLKCTFGVASRKFLWLHGQLARNIGEAGQNQCPIGHEVSHQT